MRVEKIVKQSPEKKPGAEDFPGFERVSCSVDFQVDGPNNEAQNDHEQAEKWE